MPSVTYDGRSFMLDGRRVWIVSGSIHYARVPEAHWADRINAARLAGLNTIETPIFWARHEPRPGHFDFEGDNNIRHFIELIGQAGMHCILRPGPYIGSAWDFGGLPVWLREAKDVSYRTANGAFLEACSRFLTALAEQVRDLQITAPGGGGPLLLIQNESQWTCGDDALADGYLRELNRYLREAGLNVPTINANNLWQGVEGEIDCWSGSEEMLATLRQLGRVRPDQPRIVIDFSVSRPARFGHEEPAPMSPWAVQRRLAEVLAGGGQFNVDPFHGGTNFGFSGGRLTGSPSAFVTNTNDRNAPLAESGMPGASYHAVRRIATFASRFGKVFANLDEDYRPVVADPAAPPALKSKGSRRASGGACITHASGSQGSVAFIFGEDPAVTGAEPGGGEVTLLLPDGSALPVHLGQQAVAWCLFDVHLGGRTYLDFTSLNLFGLLGKVLVCFGPAGTPGLISLNGSPVEIEVPKGKKPTIFEHEGITLVVCSEEQIDNVYIAADAVCIGVAGLDTDGEPLPIGSARQYARVASDGKVANKSFGAKPAPKPAQDKATLSGWAVASATDYADGTSPRFAAIDGPAELGLLGSAHGYGWYRLTLKSPAAKKAKVIAPESADRLQFILDGQPVGVLGLGPGATSDISLPLKKGSKHLVILADNLGRYASGPALGESKGLYGHIWEHTAFKAGKPTIEQGSPLEPLKFRSPLWEVRPGDVTDTNRITWSFIHRRKAPIFITFENTPCRGLLVLNDEPIAFIDRGGIDQITLDQETLTRGKNTLQFAPLSDDGLIPEPEQLLKDLSAQVSFAVGENCISGKADWAFAKWEPPAPSSYEAVAKTAMESVEGPSWWRCHFEASKEDGPLFLDVSGLSKGQIYLNGHHVGRYFATTADGTPVPPQTRHYLPACWMRDGEDNELVIFDEHGGNPGKCKLLYDPPTGVA